MIGKTIARVEERPTDIEGYRRDDTVRIHFTDGTALEIQGSSYEEVSLDWDVLDRDEVRARQRAAAGRRERERMEELRRQEWRSISCDERVARNAERDAKAGPFGMLLKQEYQGAILDMLVTSNRMTFGLGPVATTIKGHCKRCGERFCENAPDIPVYARPELPSGNVYVEMGTALLDPDGLQPGSNPGRESGD